MKDFTKRYLPIIISASFIAGTIYGPLLPVMAESNKKKQDRPIVRVTTGIQQVQGWEQGLVRANPNLGRWHWDPIYSYKQGLGRVRAEPLQLNNGQTGNKVAGKPAGAAYKYNVPAPQDSRPIHIPFSSKALAQVQAQLAQPVQPQYKNSVYGKLASKQTQARIMPPAVATYGHPYQEKPDTSLKYSSDKIAVYGQLLNETKNPRYNQAKTVRQRRKK